MGDLYHRDVSKTVFQHGSGQPEASGAHVFAGLVILLVGAAIGSSVGSDAVTYVLVAIGIAAIISAFLMITRQYERAVILRLGKYNRQAGRRRRPDAPPICRQRASSRHRGKGGEFYAEHMLTKDNVPVTIDAILRYRIIEERAKDSILNVEDINEMIQQVSQATLRSNIGSSAFQDVLSKREEINLHVKSIIASEASNWGVQVTGVETRQVIIPQELEAAMSMEAQIDREKDACVKYGDSEVQVAK